MDSFGVLWPCDPFCGLLGRDRILLTKLGKSICTRRLASLVRSALN